MPTPEEKVQEAMDERKGNFGDPEETTTDTDENETVTEAVEESSTSEETSEETTESEGDDEESSSLDDAIPEETEEPSPKKSGVQKRIDRLTAEKKALEARLLALEEKSTKSEKKERVYSEEELTRASQKAIADGDMALLDEVYKERQKNLEKRLINMYQQEQQSKQQATSAQQVEWKSIVERYSSNDPEFDIRNKDSKLFALAKSYFEDSELANEYKGNGGMMRAVADAFLELVKLNKKKTKKTPIEKKLERKLAKEKSKTQLGTGSSEKGTTTPKIKSTGDNTLDYIAERKAQRSARMGGSGF